MNKAIIIGLVIVLIVLTGCDELTPRPPIKIEKVIRYSENGTKLIECNGNIITSIDTYNKTINFKCTS